MGFWGFWGTKIENSPGSTNPKNHFEPVDHSGPAAAIGDGPGSSPGPGRALWMAQAGTGTLGIAPFNRPTSGTRSRFWAKYKDRSPGSRNVDLGGKPGIPSARNPALLFLQRTACDLDISCPQLLHPSACPRAAILVHTSNAVQAMTSSS